MTKVRLFVSAAVIGTFWAGAVRAQTAISVAQMACPVSNLPVVAVALPSLAGAKQARLTCIPLDPKSFVVDTSTVPATLKAIVPAAPVVAHTDSEAPAGVVNGTNLAFSLAAAPAPVGSLHLWRNGVRLTVGADYSLAGSVVMFVAGAQPQPGDTLLADYRH